MSTGLLAAGVFGDSLSTLRDSMFGELTRKPETNSSLNFPTSNGRFLVVLGKTRSLSSNSLEDVVDKGVHDAHSFTRDTGLGMYLLQNLVDIDRIALLSVLSSLLLICRNLRFGGSFFLAFLACNFAGHVEITNLLLSLELENRIEQCGTTAYVFPYISGCWITTMVCQQI